MNEQVIGPDWAFILSSLRAQISAVFPWLFSFLVVGLVGIKVIFRLLRMLADEVGNGPRRPVTIEQENQIRAVVCSYMLDARNRVPLHLLREECAATLDFKVGFRELLFVLGAMQADGTVRRCDDGGKFYVLVEEVWFEGGDQWEDWQIQAMQEAQEAEWREEQARMSGPLCGRCSCPASGVYQCQKEEPENVSIL